MGMVCEHPVSRALSARVVCVSASGARSTARGNFQCYAGAGAVQNGCS